MLISALETINRGRGSGRARGREFERELGQQNQDHRSQQSFLIRRSLRKRRVPERPPEAAQSWVTHRVVQGLHVYVQRTPVIFACVASVLLCPITASWFFPWELPLSLPQVPWEVGPTSLKLHGEHVTRPGYSLFSIFLVTLIGSDVNSWPCRSKRAAPPTSLDFSWCHWGRGTPFLMAVGDNVMKYNIMWKSTAPLAVGEGSAWARSQHRGWRDQVWIKDLGP